MSMKKKESPVKTAPASAKATAGMPAVGAAKGGGSAKATAEKPVTKGTGEMKQLLAMGKEKGYLTYKDVNDILPDEVVSSEQIDDVLTMLGESGIEIVDEAKDEGKVAEKIVISPDLRGEEEGESEEKEEKE